MLRRLGCDQEIDQKQDFECQVLAVVVMLWDLLHPQVIGVDRYGDSECNIVVRLYPRPVYDY
jgi:hypothetical protein